MASVEKSKFDLRLVTNQQETKTNLNFKQNKTTKPQKLYSNKLASEQNKLRNKYACQNELK